MLEQIKESGIAMLEHDAEKWVSVFGKHPAPARKHHAPAISQSAMTIRKQVML
jgi:hypothetical protein